MALHAIQHLLRSAFLAALLLACGPRPQPPASHVEGDEALFVRLGGQRAVATLASDWAAQAGGQQPGAQLAELVCAVASGPCDAPAVARRWRAQNLAQDRVAELLRSLEQTLARCHIAVPERDELLRGVRSLLLP